MDHLAKYGRGREFNVRGWKLVAKLKISQLTKYAMPVLRALAFRVVVAYRCRADNQRWSVVEVRATPSAAFGLRGRLTLLSIETFIFPFAFSFSISFIGRKVRVLTGSNR